ncbi:MAG TPA: hypothetical protein VLJ61_19390 [Pyrinomonadaceae bacterium]|nr:hypothetical protein [Pyrinomonadaceae bacterium]
MSRNLFSLAVVILLFCACSMMQTKWETINEGGFTAQMPGTPNRQTQSVNAGGSKIDITMLSVTKGNEAFIVGYNDIPPAIAQLADANSETFLNNARDGAVQNVHGHVTSEHAITIDGHPGKEFTGDGTSPDASKQEGTFTARVYWVNPRLYQVLYVRPKTTSAPSEDGQKFLDSFKLSGSK